MTTIEQIKSALQAHIAEAEAATPGPWEVHDRFKDDHTICAVNPDDTCSPLFERCGNQDDADAAFIAHARTMSPAACKCLLLAIEGLEHTLRHAYFEEKNDHEDVKDTLESIRQEWHNLTTTNNP